MLIVPFALPLHNASLVEFSVTTNGVGSVIVIVFVASHPKLSTTVTTYKPGPNNSGITYPSASTLGTGDTPVQSTE